MVTIERTISSAKASVSFVFIYRMNGVCDLNFNDIYFGWGSQWDASSGRGAYRVLRRTYVCVCVCAYYQ